MISVLKKLATSKKMTIFVCSEIVLLLIATFIYIHKLNIFTGVNFEGLELMLFSVACAIEIIPITLLLVTAILLEKGVSNKLFIISLIVGAIIPVYSVISGDMWGGNGVLEALMRILLTIPTILIIIFHNKHIQKHKSAFAVSALMLAIQVVSFFVTLAVFFLIESEFQQGLYLSSLFTCVIHIIHWFVVLLYLARSVKIEKNQKASPISIEGQLQIIKQQYDSGAITQEEYREQKAELLKRI